MKFYNINWTTKKSGNRNCKIPAATISGLPTEMDVSCKCGHRWHSTRGNEEGQITRGVHGEVTCPSCGYIDNYRHQQLPMIA